METRYFKITPILGAALLAAAVALPSHAGVATVTVQGREAIFLAGRVDLVIPSLGSPFALLRHPFIASDFIKEAFPTGLVVRGGGLVQVARPASGGIDFFNAPSATFYPPEGETSITSKLSGLGGVSGYFGPAGALVGIFLNDTNPALALRAPTMDFSTPLSREFITLRPGLRQVFFIGNGVTSSGSLQRFVPPAGATRLFVGIADGGGFVGAPGFYEDNNGSYRIDLSISP
jgi:hypothetical protein